MNYTCTNCICIICSLSLLVSFCSSQLFPFLGPGHTAALRSAVLLTLALDQDQGLDQDQYPDLTLIPPVDPAPAHGPMAGLIPVHLILDVMDVVMGAHEQGPALVQGLMGIGGLVHHGLLCPTEVEPGRERKNLDPTGLGHALALLVVTGAAPLVDESHFLES